MNKKLGSVLLFIGTYLVLLAGLFWCMYFDTPALQHLYKPYDWVWGLGIAIILVIGTVFSMKGYILGIIGLSLVAIGFGLSIWLLLYGIIKEQYFSVMLLIGMIFVLVGFVISLIFHILQMIKIKKKGNSLM